MARPGSDARARAAFRKLTETDDQAIISKKMVIGVSALLRFLATCLILPLLWISSLIVLPPFFLIGFLRCYRISDHIPVEQWKALFHLLGELPYTSLTKIIEFIYISGCPIERPAMEIGTYDGAHSSCVFAGKSLDIGMEYVANRLIGFAESGKQVFKNLISANIFQLPIADGCMGTIYVIHSFDDFEHDVRPALMQISRSLMSGGRLVDMLRGNTESTVIK